MANSAQAKFSMYSTILDEQEKRRKEQEDYIEQETKRANRASFGSILGSLLAAVATGGASIPITALAAAGGSRIGSEIGERAIGKEMKELNEKDYLFGITGDEGIRAQKSDREALRKQFNQGQNVAAIKSGVTAGITAGMGGADWSSGVSGGGTTAISGANVPVAANEFINSTGQAVNTDQLNFVQKLSGLGGGQTGQNSILEALKDMFTKNSQQSLFARYGLK